jgi:medium-chain acyl-[acyl-carrier-protein] hydrolase
LTSMSKVVELLGHAIQHYCDKPFTIFGHSNGAIIGFELARWLRRHGLPGPLQLFVSGSAAPHIPPDKPPIHQLPEQEFLEEIAKLDGTPPEVLGNPEIMELVSPMLRADMALHETYVYEKEEKLPCPIHAFGGEEDKEVTVTDLEAWSIHTSGKFKARIFPGNHFFLRHSPEMLNSLREDLHALLN